MEGSHQRGQIFIDDELEVVEDDSFAGTFGIFGAENEDALAAEQEGIEVGNADVRLAEDLDGVGSTAGLVVQSNGKHVGEGHGDACLLQFFVGTGWLGTDDTVDAIFHRVGNGGGDELYVGFLEDLQHALQCAGLILYEYG